MNETYEENKGGRVDDTNIYRAVRNSIQIQTVRAARLGGGDCRHYGNMAQLFLTSTHHFMPQ